VKIFLAEKGALLGWFIVMVEVLKQWTEMKVQKYDSSSEGPSMGCIYKMGGTGRPHRHLVIQWRRQ
jgi:hypothetical protein